MGLFRKSIIKELEEVGFKKVRFFDIWVHPKTDTVFSCKELRGRFWSVTKLAVNTPEDPARYKTINHFTGSKPLHKLKAITFLDLPDKLKAFGDNLSYDDILSSGVVVNHIDGNKLNDDVENLEWSTHGKNNTHAFETGLRTDNYFGVCKDVVDDKEFEFYSINSLGKTIGIHPDYISRYLKSKRESLLSHRYSVKLRDEEYPVELTIDDVWRPSIHGIQPIVVTDTKTGDVSYYAQLKDALVHAGKTTPFKRKVDLEKVIAIGEFTLGPVRDYDQIVSIRDSYNSRKKESLTTNRQNKKPLPIIVTYKNGEEVKYDSLDIFAQLCGVKKSRLKARIFRYGGFWNDLHIRYSPAKVKVLEPNLPELLENAQKSST